MLRFSQQDEFEAWLRACPLGPRSLSYSVTRSGDEGILSVACAWRVNSDGASVPLAVPRCRSRSPDEAHASWPPSHPPAHAPCGNLVHEAASPAPGTPSAAAGAEGNTEEIAALRANLERMQVSFARTPCSLDLSQRYGKVRVNPGVVGSPVSFPSPRSAAPDPHSPVLSRPSLIFYFLASRLLPSHPIPCGMERMQGVMD